MIAARGPVIAPVAALPPAVTIDAPAQGAALRTADADVRRPRGGDGQQRSPTVTLRLFPGAGETESSAPAQTLSAPVAAARWSATAAPTAPTASTPRARRRPATRGRPGSARTSSSRSTRSRRRRRSRRARRGERRAQRSRRVRRLRAGRHVHVRGRRAQIGAVRLAGDVAHLRLGGHSFAVRARDAAGNPQAMPTRSAGGSSRLCARWRRGSPAPGRCSRRPAGRGRVRGPLPRERAARRCAGRRGTLARADVRRTRAGAFALRLRPRGSAAAVAAARGAASDADARARRARRRSRST